MKGGRGQRSEYSLVSWGRRRTERRPVACHPAEVPSPLSTSHEAGHRRHKHSTMMFLPVLRFVWPSATPLSVGTPSYIPAQDRKQGNTSKRLLNVLSWCRRQKFEVCIENINDHWNVKRSIEGSFDKTEQLDQFKNSSPETTEKSSRGLRMEATRCSGQAAEENMLAWTFVK